MTDTPITDKLREHLAEHPGDIDAIVDAVAEISPHTSNQGHSGGPLAP